MVIHVQLLALSCAKANKNFIAYLTSWHNSIFVSFYFNLDDIKKTPKREAQEKHIRTL